MCCHPRGLKESDMTEGLTTIYIVLCIVVYMFCVHVCIYMHTKAFLLHLIKV